MKEWPTQIRLVHGEAAAKKVLGNILSRKYSLENARWNCLSLEGTMSTLVVGWRGNRILASECQDMMIVQ